MYVLLFQQGPVVNPGDGLGAAVYHDYDRARAAFDEEVKDHREWDPGLFVDGDNAWGDDWSLAIIPAHNGTGEMTGVNE